jgi:hypothetical protein
MRQSLPPCLSHCVVLQSVPNSARKSRRKGALQRVIVPAGDPSADHNASPTPIILTGDPDTIIAAVSRGPQ